MLCDQVATSDGRCDKTQSCSNELCQSCLVTDAQEFCLQCVEGYQLKTGQDNECVQTTEQTQGCYSSDDDGKCDFCAFGYYLVNLHQEDVKCKKSDRYSFVRRWSDFGIMLMVGLWIRHG